MKTEKGKQKRAMEIAIVLGVVFIIMGFAYGNLGVRMLGFIFLAIGFYARARIGRGTKQ